MKFLDILSIKKNSRLFTKKKFLIKYQQPYC